MFLKIDPYNKISGGYIMSILEKWKDESLRITNYGSNH
jgi:hypothetical protein